METFEDFYRNSHKGKTGNIRTPMARLLFPVKVNSLAQFTGECCRAENLLYNQKGNLVEGYNQETYILTEINNRAEVDAMAGATKLTCWNCKTEGHKFINCTTEYEGYFVTNANWKTR